MDQCFALHFSRTTYNTVFILTKKFTSDSDVALNGSTAGMRAGCQIQVSETNGYVTTTIERPMYLALMSVHRIAIQYSSNFQIRISF